MQRDDHGARADPPDHRARDLDEDDNEQDVDQDIAIGRSMSRFDAGLLVLALVLLVAMIVIAATP